MKGECHFCGAVGYIRSEQVYKGTEAWVEMYCGSCNRTWTTNDRRHAPRPVPQRHPKTVILRGGR